MGKNHNITAATGYYHGVRAPHPEVFWTFGERTIPLVVLPLGVLGPGKRVDWGRDAAGTPDSLRLAFALAFHHLRRLGVEDPIMDAHNVYRDVERRVVRGLAAAGFLLRPGTLDVVMPPGIERGKPDRLGRVKARIG